MVLRWPSPRRRLAPEGSRANDSISGSVGFVYGSFAPQSQWENYFKGFKKLYPNVKINYIPVPLDDWGSYATKVATLIAGGQKVDVIWIATEGVPSLASRGVLTPLDSYLQKDKANPELKNYLHDVSPALLKALQYQGKQYELPFAWNDEEMWYNPALFGAAHLAAPSPTWGKSWTWSDYLRDAQALTKDTNGDGTPDVYGTYVDTSWFSLGGLAVQQRNEPPHARLEARPGHEPEGRADDSVPPRSGLEIPCGPATVDDERERSVHGREGGDVQCRQMAAPGVQAGQVHRLPGGSAAVQDHPGHDARLGRLRDHRA